VRVGVVELLARSREPLAVPDMLRRLPRDTDAVTVYRTLNTFTRKKLVHRVRGEDRTWRYALSAVETKPPQHQHPHFVCSDCGTVQCLTGARIPASLIRMLGVGDGYDLSYAEVVLHGRCPKCR
jgi:Fur family ferric uptake transcriptional regulator